MITTLQGYLIRQAVSEKGMSAHEVARDFALPLSLVWRILHGKEPPGGYRKIIVKDDQFEEEGRIELRKYVVARRTVEGSEWSRPFAVAHARAQYDAGNVELAQGRSKSHFFLYAFPLKEKTTRVPYFGTQPITIEPEE